MKCALTFFKLLVQNVWIMFLGLLATLGCLAVVILGSPLYFYRWIVTKKLAPLRPHQLQSDRVDGFGKAVTVNGNALAAEFLTTNFIPRCSTTINLTIDGPISYNEVYQVINEKWINFRTEQGALKYPEFQQYPESWMGFMFWKRDVDFKLENHIKWYNMLEEKKNSSGAGGGCVDNVEQFKCQLIEDLVNRPYVSRRSPWDIHIIEYFREEVGSTPEKSQKLLTFGVILRIHHCMADGYALLHVLLEQLSGNRLESCLVISPDLKCPKYTKTINVLVKNLIGAVTFPVRAIYELGIVLSWGLRNNSPFHIPDRKKNWKQVYARMKPVPISKIKRIKRAFGVGFVSVCNSALAAAVAKMLKKWNQVDDKRKDEMRELLLSIAVPLPNHPKKMRMHVLGAALYIPVTSKISSLERLKKCEANVQHVKNSPMVLLAGAALKIYSAFPSVFARYLMFNRVLPATLTSFPGPGLHVKYQGRKVLGMDFAAGTLGGVCGVGFMALSYADQLQICATAETAVLSREELKELLEYVYQEFDVLSELVDEYKCENVETENLCHVEKV